MVTVRSFNPPPQVSTPKDAPWTEAEKVLYQLEQVNLNLTSLIKFLETPPPTPPTPTGVSTNFPLALFFLADDSGTSNSGTNNSLTDQTKGWQVNLWVGALLQMIINSQLYVTVILSNTESRLVFSPLPAGVQPTQTAYAINAKNLFSLKLRRSDQSGDKLMTNAYVAQYSNSAAQAYIFASAKIDLTDMQAGDTIWVRVRTKLSSTGLFVTISEISYVGIQPVGRKAIRIGVIPDTFGVEISMFQVAAPFRTLACEFYDAMV